MTSGSRLHIKHSGTIVLDLPYSPLQQLGEIKELVSQKCCLDRGKMNLICKGRKLNGIAFPDDLIMKEALGKNAPNAPSDNIGNNTTGLSESANIVLLQALGPKDPIQESFMVIENDLGKAERGEELDGGKPVDAVTYGEWSEKLDSLQDLNEIDRERRRGLLKRIEDLEKNK